MSEKKVRPKQLRMFGLDPIPLKVGKKTLLDAEAKKIMKAAKEKR